MTWEAVHRYGMRCDVPMADVVARSGLTPEQLERRKQVQLDGDWQLVRKVVSHG